MTGDKVVTLAPCVVRHIPPDGVSDAAAHGRPLYLVFWEGRRPAGLRLLLPGELPLPPTALPDIRAATVARQSGDQLEDAAPTATPDETVSVVICTRDRPDDLRRCLMALSRCDPAPAEILVVDNAPADDRAMKVVAERPGVRYVRETRKGLSHARNAGVVAATGSVIAFTDDDVEVAVDWIASVSAPFRRREVACVTGLVLPADLSTEAACLFEFWIGGFGKSLRARDFDAAYLRQKWWQSPEVWKIGAGANMAVRRTAFEAVGLFDPRLGAGAAGCSEDSEFWFRVLRANLVCRYEPKAVVRHYHRADRDGLARQLRAYTAGHVVALLVQFMQDRRPCHLIRIGWTMPAYYCGLAVKALLQGDRTGLALSSEQFRGYVSSPIHVMRWLRRAGPPSAEREVHSR